MGRYTTNVTTEKEYTDIINLLKTGYIDNEGIKHRPNRQVATILVLECNLGCRLGDIIAMTTDSVIKENGVYKLNIKEQKTKKKRSFIVPLPIVEYIEEWKKDNHINSGRLFDISEPAVWKALRAVTSYLGLENVSSHSFRKCAAQTLYEKSGYDVALVSQWLQHSNTAITQTYLKRNSRQMETAINCMVNIV